MVDTFRGQLRVRAWPRKRGRPTSQVTRDQNKWFKEANEIARKVEPTQMNLAIEMTKGTGLYPRDLLLRQQAGGIYEVVFEDGTSPQYRRTFRETVVFQGIICDKTATQLVPVGGFHQIIWTLPILDTAGFWNAGAPDRLTIPAGINVIELVGRWRATTGGGRSEQNLVLYKNGAFTESTVAEVVNTPAATISSGPVMVVTGDFFELRLNTTVARTVNVYPFSGLTLNVLDAD